MSAPSTAPSAPPVGVCTVCRTLVEEWLPGPGGKRPRAACPHCGSLERHRFLALVLGAVSPQLAGARALEVSPQPGVAALLADTALTVGIDVDPAADGRVVDVVTDLTATGFADAAFDLAICYHVLEHVPDDAAAMRELARVLAPAGVALVQVPRRPGPTEEDPEALPDERLRRFGQKDHVRYYGDDFEERLEAAGLRQRLVHPRDFLDGAAVDVAALVADEPIWIVTRGATGAAPGVLGDTGPVPALRDALVAQLLDALRAAGAGALRARHEEVAAAGARGDAERARAAAARASADDARRDLDRARRRTEEQARRAERWRADYRRLRGRRAVRLALAGARGLAALRSRLGPAARSVSSRRARSRAETLDPSRPSAAAAAAETSPARRA